MNFQFIGIILILFFSCNAIKKNKHTAIIKEVKKLETIGGKTKYLEKIFEADQKLRRSGEDSEIMLKYGVNSKEHKAFIKKVLAQDSVNLIQIEKYLEQHGYPNSREFGDIATATPWAVIHHAPTYEDRERNFNYLYEAYLNGAVDDEGISMFLGRMYQIKHGKRFEMKSPYNSKDEINALLKQLGLEEKKEIPNNNK